MTEALGQGSESSNSENGHIWSLIFAMYRTAIPISSSLEMFSAVTHATGTRIISKTNNLSSDIAQILFLCSWKYSMQFLPTFIKHDLTVGSFQSLSQKYYQ